MALLLQLSFPVGINKSYRLQGYSQTKIKGVEEHTSQELGVLGRGWHWCLSHGLDVCSHGRLADLLHNYVSRGGANSEQLQGREGAAGEKLVHPLFRTPRGRILHRGLPTAKEPRVLDHQ